MFRKFALVVLAATVVAGPAWAAPDLRAGHPQSYTVQRGDTLWDIAGRFLVQPWRWPEIWRANPQVRNPDLIYPGDTLVLTYVDGEPVVSVGPGEQYLGGRSYKRSPTAREEAHEQAVATIPLDIIGPFLSRPLLKAKTELELAPYVLASGDQHLLAGVGDRIYARGQLDPAVTRYTIYRQGPAYRRGGEEKAELLGYEALEVGEAVLERAGDPSTLRLTRSTREVREGDRLFPLTDEQYPDFMPRAPGAKVEGNVISVFDAVSGVGQYQVVVLDVGAENGIEPGHVLSIFQANQTARDTVGARQRVAAREPIRFERADTNAFDAFMSNLYTDVRNNKRDVDEFFGVEPRLDVETVTLPEEHTGELMVFRTFDRVSYALVMQVVRPVLLRDRVRNP